MHDGIEGWAGYKVGDRRDRPTRSYGGGVYVFNRNNPVDPHRERLRGPATRRASGCTTS